ncbi:hypothetical protein EL22_28435 [Halostagnicola sp. A56]|uniref:hypothetical protein n=1 Tax=Halostagnicola sp. A56 TaxID=1495067 RepID=UPI00065F6A70|nr:hypothetical protein [Halostagnicola sp. A56]KMT45674.1 hypothetical protein EL22_28435 [Halostagnicola sp. A56]
MFREVTTGQVAENYKYHWLSLLDGMSRKTDNLNRRNVLKRTGYGVLGSSIALSSVGAASSGESDDGADYDLTEKEKERLLAELESIAEKELKEDAEKEPFLIEKSLEGEPHMLEYNFEGGWFGLTRSEDVSKFERDVIQFKHGWLTASRIYRNLVGNETAYTEHSSRVELSESNVQKFEGEADNGDVVFAKHNDEGVISQEFANDILRAVVGTEHYRLYFASHQTVSESKNLRLESEDHSLVWISDVQPSNFFP